MPYEKFSSKNLIPSKIVANAHKFGVEELQNEELVAMLASSKQPEITHSQRAVIEEIFTKLMQIEKDVQLSG